MRSEAIDRIFSRIVNIVGEKPVGEPASIDEIADFEREFGLELPADYKQFLLKFGTIDTGDFQVFGLGVPPLNLPSVAAAVSILRIVNPKLSKSIIPVQALGAGIFACIFFRKNALKCPVVLLDARSVPAEVPILAPDFLTFLRRQVEEHEYFLAGLSTLDQIMNTQKNGWSHREGGKRPRNRDWRLFRYCVEDVILGITCVKHNQDRNCLEVDLFLTAAIPEYERDTGVRALGLMILSDAYRCGTSMEIVFTRMVEGGRIPRELTDLASRYGINLGNGEATAIAPVQATQLYLALSELETDIQERILELDRADQLSSAATCFSIHKGIWEKSEIEAIAMTALMPENVISGKHSPGQRALHRQSLSHGRAALMFGSFDRQLRYRFHSPDEDTEIHLEDDQRFLEREFGTDPFSVRYRCPHEQLHIPWATTLDDAGKEIEYEAVIAPGDSLTLLVRSYNLVGMREHLKEVIQFASTLDSNADKSSSIFILVPKDFIKLNISDKRRLLEGASSRFHLLVYPQFSSAMDADVETRLSNSRILRS